MSAMLTAEEVLKLVGEIFVYHMPFNRALGLELERYEKEMSEADKEHWITKKNETYKALLKKRTVFLLKSLFKRKAV